MAAIPTFPGFDGLMALSHREGVDIRPTLLRVLTDLYVQTPTHSDEEEQHYVALASRLIEEVDDATRAMVRARLSIYPRTPAALARQLAIAASPEPPAQDTAPPPATADEPVENEGADVPPPMPAPPMLPAHAVQLSELFFAAGREQRLKILHRLDEAPLPRTARIVPYRLDRAIETLEQAAFVGERGLFALELGNVLMLPTRLAERIVGDPGGEPLACAARALGIPQATFERILLFLDSERGASVSEVYRLARLYEALAPHAAHVLLAALRGATLTATRAKYAPHLYDDERARPRRAAMEARPAPLHSSRRKVTVGE